PLACLLPAGHRRVAAAAAARWISRLPEAQAAAGGSLGMMFRNLRFQMIANKQRGKREPRTRGPVAFREYPRPSAAAVADPRMGGTATLAYRCGPTVKSAQL